MLRPREQVSAHVVLALPRSYSQCPSAGVDTSLCLCRRGLQRWRVVSQRQLLSPVPITTLYC